VNFSDFLGAVDFLEFPGYLAAERKQPTTKRKTNMETLEKVKCNYCELEYQVDDTIPYDLPNGEYICLCEECSHEFSETHYYCEECGLYHPFENGYKSNFFHYSDWFLCPECAISKVSEREYFVNDLIHCYEPIIIDENKFLPNESSGFSLITTFPGKHSITTDYPAFRELIDRLITDGFVYNPIALVWGYDNGYFVKFYVDFSLCEEQAETVSNYTNDYL